MSKGDNIVILAIESSCDDTAASILVDGEIKSNFIASQIAHKSYGGVVPELASRQHQESIVHVVDSALKAANTTLQDLSAIAFTQGPGLLGSLLVGNAYAKGLSMGLDIPLIAVHHMEAHILAHFIEKPVPDFPFLCLTVSGGHTQIVRVDSPSQLKVLGQTIDDAAGEAFDKIGKYLGLPYPAGPEIDELAKKGSPVFSFTHPQIDGLDFSFSGLKTQVMYFIRDKIASDPGFIDSNLVNIASSVQHIIVEILVDKLQKAVQLTGIRRIGIAGGVSANSGLRNRLKTLAPENEWEIYIPRIQFCTDNAAMIAMAGYYKFIEGQFAKLDCTPMARLPMDCN